MKKKYKGIFFDWDGTAVLSRKAPVEEIVKAMGPLLDQCDSFADGKKSAHEQRFSVVRRTGSLIGGMTG